MDVKKRLKYVSDITVRTVQKTTSLALKGILLLHLGIQANNCTDVSEPRSKERIAFQEKFGFPLVSSRKDLEESGTSLAIITEAAYKEKLEKDYNLDSIRIIPEKYLDMDLSQQFGHLLMSDFGGFYVNDSVYLKKDSFWSNTIHHEIKHNKAEKIIDKHPEFKERWLELTFDESGNSLYVDSINSTLLRIRALEDLADVKKYSWKENSADGFVSNYSRRNYSEDIAELGETAEVSPRDFINWLYENPQPRIAAKVRLAEEYGLIPQEFSEFIWLWKSYEELPSCFLGITDDALFKKEMFLEDTAEFLEKYPPTVYQINIRNLRGRMLRAHMCDVENQKELALKEFKLGLKSEFKDNFQYKWTLENLASLYSSLKEPEKALLYTDALNLYQEKYKKNDVNIIIHGVNDFLIANGEELQSD